MPAPSLANGTATAPRLVQDGAMDVTLLCSTSRRDRRSAAAHQAPRRGSGPAGRGPGTEVPVGGRGAGPSSAAGGGAARDGGGARGGGTSARGRERHVLWRRLGRFGRRRTPGGPHRDGQRRGPADDHCRRAAPRRGRCRRRAAGPHEQPLLVGCDRGRPGRGADRPAVTAQRQRAAPLAGGACRVHRARPAGPRPPGAGPRLAAGRRALDAGRDAPALGTLGLPRTTASRSRAPTSSARWRSTRVASCSCSAGPVRGPSRWLERNVRCRVRFLAEERGLRASSPLAIGDAPGARSPAAGVRRSGGLGRPPPGRHREREHPGGCGRRAPRSAGSWTRAAPMRSPTIVAELADGAILDTRVLMADRLGARRGRLAVARGPIRQRPAPRRPRRRPRGSRP